MKKFKLIALLLALVMVSACFAACGDKTPKETVKAKVTVFANDDILCGPLEVELEQDAGKPVTVLQVCKEAFILNEIAYEADDISFSKIGDFGDKTEGGITYFWTYTINGVEPTAGVAGTIQVNNDDVIVYTYNAVSTEDLANADAAGDKED